MPGLLQIAKVVVNPNLDFSEEWVSARQDNSLLMVVINKIQTASHATSNLEPSENRGDFNAS